MAERGPPGAGAGAGGDAAAAADEAEDRMDLLWEDFNEELARSGAGAGGLARDPWSDAEWDEPAARGCAPALRPAARARAVRHCRRRAGAWVLLMRIFRRLFVIDKTAVSAAARRHHAATATATATAS